MLHYIAFGQFCANGVVIFTLVWVGIDQLPGMYQTSPFSGAIVSIALAMVGLFAFGRIFNQLASFRGLNEDG